jgi:D-beta-D-heptose 7-phosphate kinase/D-beta-D-heptose 1-phosphate adenosyltransferase
LVGVHRAHFVKTTVADFTLSARHLALTAAQVARASGLGQKLDAAAETASGAGRIIDRMFDFANQLSAFARQTVLCIGDPVLDEFVYGDVSRLSAEAPTPVLVVRRSEQMIGGAGNVARNVAALGGRCIYIGVTGDDEVGGRLKTAFAIEPHIDSKLVIERGRASTRKMRFVSEKHSTHVARADWEVTTPVSAETEDAIIDHAVNAMAEIGAVVIADYALGMLTKRVVRAVIEAANKAGKPVLVDPRGRDYSAYAGATIIKPNRHQLSDVVNRDVESEAEIIGAADEVRRKAGAKAVLVTRSEAGMTLVSDKPPLHVSVYPVRVRDVSGAGDTVSAAVSLMLASGASFEAAMHAANAAAAVAVGKRGTATVSLAELWARLTQGSSLAPEEKVLYHWGGLDERLEDWRKQGLRIGFTNGVFDLLHPGHVKVIAGARNACDRLVLGLNSDASVRRLKGQDRPVQNVQARAEVLAALEAVDLVVVFEEDTPAKLIAQVKPMVLVKGGDYKREDLPGYDTVTALGGEVILIDLVPGHSTTATVERSRGTKAG